ncbi:MAG: lipase family protein [Verrucomicrobiales bacterium]
MHHPFPTPKDILGSGARDNNHERSYQLSILAGLANRIPTNGIALVKKMLVAKGWQASVWNHKNNQGFLLESDEATVLVFAGSNQLSDWWKNAQAFSPDDHAIGGRTHGGFLKVLNQGIHEALKLPEASGVPLFIAAHSLGGAVATMFCAHLHAINHSQAEKLHLVTYGMPRLGTEEFAKAYNKLMADRHWYYANSRDPVTKLPTNLMGYRHVGELFYFTRKNVLTNPPRESVGLQAGEPGNEDIAAAAEWDQEEIDMAAAAKISTEQDYEVIKARVIDELNQQDDEGIALSEEEGAIVTTDDDVELEGAIVNWLAGRHFIQTYMDNLHRAVQ